MIAQYEDGAVHNDRHKEINIQVGCLSPDALSHLIAGFMDDGEEPPVAEEADFCPSQGKSASQGEPASQKSAGEGLVGGAGLPCPADSLQARHRASVEGVRAVVEQ